MSRHEVDEMPVHQVWHVFLVVQGALLTVDHVGLHFFLRVPVGAAAGIAQVIVESKVGRLQRELAPLADHRRDVARRLEHGGDQLFVFGRDFADRVLIAAARAETVAAGENLRARRSAEGNRVGMRVTRAAAREGVDVRRLVVVGAVAADFTDPVVVGEDKDDVGTIRGEGRGCGEQSEAGGPKRERERGNERSFH